jgi:hypothetical protein
MDEQTLTRVLTLLETDPDFYVPVKKLWTTLLEEGLAFNVALADFQRALEADDRFEFIAGVEDDGGPALDTETIHEMELAGIYTGPRVKLAARQMTPEDVFNGLSRSLSQLSDALRRAFDIRPTENNEAEEMLIGALTMTEQLEQDVKEMLTRHGKADTP